MYYRISRNYRLALLAWSRAQALIIGRELSKLGHDVKLINPAYVKPRT